MEKDMRIYVKGKNEYLSKKECKFLLEFLGKELLGKLSNYVYVELQFKDLEKGTWGFCSPTDYDYKNHREFEILINRNLVKYNQIKTICHEMVHVKQFARKELRDFNYNVFKWKGEKLTIDDNDYYSSPWEVEALSKEKPLYKLYKKHRKENGAEYV